MNSNSQINKNTGRKIQVALVFGGKSPEHEISLLSAKNIYEAMDREKFEPILIGISQQGTWFLYTSPQVFNFKKIEDSNKELNTTPITLISKNEAPQIYNLKDHSYQPIEIAFPVLHGTFGEDGCIQGFFKLLNLPFVGCDVWSSAAGMDKEVMKRILNEAKIPNARHILITPENTPSYATISSQIGSPFFIKPANMGSSVGVYKISSEQDFQVKLKDSFRYDFKILAEEFIKGREIECAVLGTQENPQASTAGEVIPLHDFYSYEAKYLDEKGADLKIPADLSAQDLHRVQTLAKKVFSTMGCDGFSRVDFFLKTNGEIYVNEINTIPGFTKISMYPKMWEASGLAYKNLITQLIDLGLARFKKASSLERAFSKN
jgi:D-alanine-D-alanine ligase